jgi:hypothetical protein
MQKSERDAALPPRRAHAKALHVAARRVIGDVRVAERDPDDLVAVDRKEPQGRVEALALTLYLLAPV